MKPTFIMAEIRAEIKIVCKMPTKCRENGKFIQVRGKVGEKIRWSVPESFNPQLNLSCSPGFNLKPNPDSCELSLVDLSYNDVMRKNPCYTKYDWLNIFPEQI